MSKEKFKYTKEFLEKVKNGDNDATTLLYEDAKDIAYNKAYSILNNHHDAEDIAEDSVLRAIEKIDTIKKPSEFPAWIRRIAENKAKDYIKKDKPTYMGEDFEYTTNDQCLFCYIEPIYSIFYFCFYISCITENFNIFTVRK